MLKVQEFIKRNSDWEVLLSQEPYNLIISHDEFNGRGLVLLKYNQLSSDFSNEIVRECRGLILDADTHEIVCFPFVKFFNYGEAYADSIDWSTAYVTEKLDGSIAKIVNLDGKFLISTNGTINAFKADINNNLASPFGTFGELIMEGFKFYGLTEEDFPRLFKPGFTYMFELTSPWNQVVVKWPDTKVSLIGIRDNSTMKEQFFGDSELAKIFNTPKIYPITSIEQCIEAAKHLKEDAEGYVVVDADFNRIKVKSPIYIQLHYMAGNQCWSPARVLDIIRSNEVSEYVAYFPMFKVAFDKFKAEYDAYVRNLNDIQNHIDNLLEVYNGHMPKKNFAKWVFANNGIRPYSGFAFAYFDCSFGKSDKGIRSAKDYVAQMNTSHLLKALGY